MVVLSFMDNIYNNIILLISIMYSFRSNELVLKSVDLTKEIIRDNRLLKNKDITIFNSSVLPIKDTNDFLVASRGWYGNIRTWDGMNFIILTIMSSNYKKKRQNIIDIDVSILKEKNLKFKEFKKKIIEHQKTVLEGPEDPRLFYYKNNIFMLINEIDDVDKDPRKRHMYLSTIDLETLDYDTPKTKICEILSSNFEKNWGPFTYKNKMYMLYDINPLRVMEVVGANKCKMILNKNDKTINKIENSFGDLNFHLRNSSNLIPFSGKLLGMGHAVLDYKGSTDLNKFLIPTMESSKYDKIDKEYFKRFYKLYLGFFFILDMNKGEITKLSPFFQLPSKEAKQELIFFPTTICEDNNGFVDISYSLGDNRSYVCKLHSEVIKTSLYEKNNIDMHMNYNVNTNYYLELLRTLRIVNKFSPKPEDFNIFVEA